MTRYLSVLVWLLVLPVLPACKTGPDPGVKGIYQTWDDVITRWIGKHKEDLYLELGPPNLGNGRRDNRDGMGHDD